MSRQSLEKTHIKYQPLGDEIHIAEMASNGRCALNKVVRTEDFCEALLQWCEVGEKREIAVGDKVIAVVTVTAPIELPKTPAEEYEETSNRC